MQRHVYAVKQTLHVYVFGAVLCQVELFFERINHFEEKVIREGRVLVVRIGSGSHRCLVYRQIADFRVDFHSLEFEGTVKVKKVDEDDAQIRLDVV